MKLRGISNSTVMYSQIPRKFVLIYLFQETLCAVVIFYHVEEMKRALREVS